MSGDPWILLAPERELVYVWCTAVDLLSTSVLSALSELASSVRPKGWETGVMVSSTSEAEISLNDETGLLSLDIFFDHGLVLSSHLYNYSQEIKLINFTDYVILMPGCGGNTVVLCPS